MTEFFKQAKAKELGIPNEYIMNFSKRLEEKHLPMHSIMLMRHDKLIYESFYAPYTRDSLHRMFSVTKSFVSLGIGLLIEEGKLSLDDHIVDFFPDKLPKGEVHPFLKMMTIRDMLEMRSCHRFTTYKATGVSDWLGSFFTTKPTHVPGTNFAYDTSSTHTLGILIERLSGKNFFDYLRDKFLNELEFSKEAYVLTDPTNMSMGGSGLNCSSLDLLKVFYLVVHKGDWFGKQLLPKEYIEDAISCHSDNWAKSDTLEEMQGYGEALSYYPVTCVADDPDLDLKVGEGCGVTLMDANTDSGTFYLPMAFVREDTDGYYVLVDQNGRLEKRYVKTGVILWGSEIEIRSGLTMEDSVAFPYGKTAHAGAHTQPGDLEKLYSAG